jgi:hypothetical protein
MLLKQRRLYSCKNRTKRISCISSLFENESIFLKTPQALAQEGAVPTLQAVGLAAALA